MTPVGRCPVNGQRLVGSHHRRRSSTPTKGAGGEGEDDLFCLRRCQRHHSGGRVPSGTIGAGCLRQSGQPRFPRREGCSPANGHDSSVSKENCPLLRWRVSTGGSSPKEGMRERNGPEDRLVFFLPGSHGGGRSEPPVHRTGGLPSAMPQASAFGEAEGNRFSSLGRRLLGWWGQQEE